MHGVSIRVPTASRIRERAASLSAEKAAYGKASNTPIISPHTTAKHARSEKGNFTQAEIERSSLLARGEFLNNFPRSPRRPEIERKLPLSRRRLSEKAAYGKASNTRNICPSTKAKHARSEKGNFIQAEIERSSLLARGEILNNFPRSPRRPEIERELPLSRRRLTEKAAYGKASNTRNICPSTKAKHARSEKGNFIQAEIERSPPLFFPLPHFYSRFKLTSIHFAIHLN